MTNEKSRKILLAGLVTEQEILNVMTVENKAIKLLSEPQSDIYIEDAIDFFNKTHEKLKLDVYSVVFKTIETQFYLVGLPWEKIPPNMTKSDMSVFVESEIKRFLDIDVKVTMECLLSEEMDFCEEYSA